MSLSNFFNNSVHVFKTKFSNNVLFCYIVDISSYNKNLKTRAVPASVDMGTKRTN